MTTPNVSITFPVSDEFTYEVMDTAHAYAYEWFDIGVAEWGRPNADGYEPPLRLTVTEYEEGMEKETKRIGPNEIREGIRRILQNDVTVNEEYALFTNVTRSVVFQAVSCQDSALIEPSLADEIMQAAFIGYRKYA